MDSERPGVPARYSAILAVDLDGKDDDDARSAATALHGQIAELLQTEAEGAREITLVGIFGGGSGFMPVTARTEIVAQEPLCPVE